MGRLKAAQCRLRCVCFSVYPQWFSLNGVLQHLEGRSICLPLVERRSYLRAVLVRGGGESAMIKRDKMFSFQKLVRSSAKASRFRFAIAGYK